MSNPISIDDLVGIGRRAAIARYNELFKPDGEEPLRYEDIDEDEEKDECDRAFANAVWDRAVEACIAKASQTHWGILAPTEAPYNRGLNNGAREMRSEIVDRLASLKRNGNDNGL